MDVDIETLARYPMESDDWLVTVLVGGILALFSFLILPAFVLAGYFVRALRAGMDAAEEPPVFDDWGTMLKEGGIATVIGFVYQLVPLLVFVVLVGGSIAALLSGSDVGLVGLLFGAFASWVLSLVFGYVGLAGIVNYADEGTFGAGFDFEVIADVATDRAYLLAWAYVVLLQIVVAVVVGVLNVVPILGGLVGVFVSFYAVPIAGWLLGNGFAESVEGRAKPEPDTADAVQ